MVHVGMNKRISPHFLFHSPHDRQIDQISVLRIFQFIILLSADETCQIFGQCLVDPAPGFVDQNPGGPHADGAPESRRPVDKFVDQSRLCQRQRRIMIAVDLPVPEVAHRRGIVPEHFPSCRISVADIEHIPVDGIDSAPGNVHSQKFPMESIVFSTQDTVDLLPLDTYPHLPDPFFPDSFFPDAFAKTGDRGIAGLLSFVSHDLPEVLSAGSAADPEQQGDPWIGLSWRRQSFRNISVSPVY